MYPHVAPICHILTRVVGSGLLPMTIGWIDYMILGQYHRQHVSSFYITSTLLPLSTIENWLPSKSHSALITTRVCKLYYNFTLKVRMYHPCTYSQWNRTTWRFSSRSQLTSSSATCLHNRGLISLIQSFRGTNSNLWTCKTRYKT